MSSIYQLIPLVMADIGSVSKDRKNEQQKYAFRGIEDFYKAAHPAFIRHGVFCVPEVIEHSYTTFEKSGYEGKTTVWRHVTMKVKHQFFAGDGSHVDVVTVGEGLDNSDKATNKAMSGAMKYALIELFSVPTEDVEDSDRTSPEAGRPNGNGHPSPPKDETSRVDYITVGQVTNLEVKFKNALCEELKPQAGRLLIEFIGKRFNDPSVLHIPSDKYVETGKAAVAHAKELTAFFLREQDQL